MNNKALINSFVWPGLPFCARLTLTVVVRFFLRLTAKILSFLRLTAKFLAVLRLTVNPIETLFKAGMQNLLTTLGLALCKQVIQFQLSFRASLQCRATFPTHFPPTFPKPIWRRIYDRELQYENACTAG